VPSGVVIKEEDFSHNRVCGSSLVAATTGDFLKNLLNIGTRHIGFGQPIEGEEKISLHSAGGTQLGPKKRIGESAKVFHGSFRLFEDVHAGGGGHRIEHQVIVPSAGVPPKETIFVLKVGIQGENEGRGRVYRL
jgi:hypothetical protein